MGAFKGYIFGCSAVNRCHQNESQWMLCSAWVPSEWESMDALQCMGAVRMRVNGCSAVNGCRQNESQWMLCSEWVPSEWESDKNITPVHQLTSGEDKSWSKSCIKGTVHPKMKILSSFTHPHVDPKPVCSEHKGRYSEECEKQSSNVFSSMEVNGAPKQPDYKLSSKYFPLCSEQTHSYRFRNTWGWVNDDRIFIFGCTVPLRGF